MSDRANTSDFTKQSDSSYQLWLHPLSKLTTPKLHVDRTDLSHKKTPTTSDRANTSDFTKQSDSSYHLCYHPCPYISNPSRQNGKAVLCKTTNCPAREHVKIAIADFTLIWSAHVSKGPVQAQAPLLPSSTVDYCWFHEAIGLLAGV